MSYFAKILFSALVVCQIGHAVPQLKNCVLAQGNVDCDISGRSSDFAIQCDMNDLCKLKFPGYYFLNRNSASVTMTTVVNTDPVGFIIEWDSETKNKRWMSQLMLTKSTGADFVGRVRLVNDWLLSGWSNL